ncbi:tRNA delta(2)-isopentenylpyrophosphate transferase [Streptococcus varani]|uniref:tRNA dimethylallyltransferase n=1 Tax=Streptococcus varani TaxID=1608583 RepID=A0A0E3WF13_9STRE|nr:tRNA (adenosine(37)-N6)-dimethylallyltransferase MiaA [Streptococcus varani]CQR24679.1 tRNA delta(2)-isopentenylpyrophosphate transferase [Streptococcus varani]
MKRKIIVVLGPTAVGKSALGIELVQRFQGEIISGDSQQVYQELNIGTAKVNQEEQEQAVHHLIDVCSVQDGYSAFDFVQEARKKIEDITERGYLPIIVGGTGLYLQSLLEGYHLGGNVDQEALLAYRSQLETWSQEKLYQAVEENGIAIPQINRRRAIRALELHQFGQDLTNQDQDYDVFIIGLTDEREQLYDRINKRVDLMMEAGLLVEVEWLYQTYPQSQASMGIGYKEFYPYFAGEISLDEAVDKVKQNSRRFAKRQLTWFRNRMNVEFYTVSESDFKEKIFAQVEGFLHD